MKRLAGKGVVKKVLLRFYAANNLGDDLFVKIITDRYTDFFTVISQKNSKYFATISNLRIVSNPLVIFFCKLVGKVIGKNNLLELLISRRQDYMVYAGGSIFMENNNMEMWKREAQFYQALKVPYYILGSNVGPYKNSHFPLIVSDIFKGSEDVCLRDQASYDLVRGLSTARVAADIVFSLDTSNFVVENNKIAIFSLINTETKFDVEVTRRYEQSIQAMSMQLLDKGYRVIYMSFCRDEGDEEASLRIRGGLPKVVSKRIEELNYDGDINAALSVIASSEIVIASRFHASILGLVFGKRILPMAYSDKTINVLKDAGFLGQVIDIRKIEDFNFSKVDFSSIPTLDIVGQKLLAEEQFEALDKVLERRV